MGVASSCASSASCGWSGYDLLDVLHALTAQDRKFKLKIFIVSKVQGLQTPAFQKIVFIKISGVFFRFG